MPRYYFDVRDDVHSRDKTGTDLADQQAARREAVALAGRIIADRAQQIALGADWSIDVTDETGASVFQVMLIMVESPVLGARMCEAVP